MMMSLLVLQVQQAKDALSEERHMHQESQHTLHSSQELLTAAKAEQQQLKLQVADLELQLEGSIAEQKSTQDLLDASEAKLQASQNDETEAQAKVLMLPCNAGHCFTRLRQVQCVIFAVSGSLTMSPSFQKHQISKNNPCKPEPHPKGIRASARMSCAD